MGQYPFGGMAWQVLHHMLGFERLGLEAYYVENSGAPPYSPKRQSVMKSASENIQFLADTFARFGLSDRWVYWDCLTNEWPGLGKTKANELLQHADLIVNVCGASRPDPEQKRTGCLVYIETDPVFEQIKLARGDEDSRVFLESHDVLFTYGTRIGDSNCEVPTGGFAWYKMHPPVVTDLWYSAPPAHGNWRTVATYRNSGKDFVFKGRTYHWSKHPNYDQVMDLPSRTSETIEVALVTAGDQAVRERFLQNRWKLEDPVAVSSDPEIYRAYIQGARGEFSVEKQDYTDLKVGWFSDRSVCFLAAGRPCVVQDTGIGSSVPTGEGLLVWNTMEEALECLERVTRDYRRHCEAAARIAREYFEASLLLRSILAAARLLPTR